MGFLVGLGGSLPPSCLAVEELYCGGNGIYPEL